MGDTYHPLQPPHKELHAEIPCSVYKAGAKDKPEQWEMQVEPPAPANIRTF